MLSTKFTLRAKVLLSMLAVLFVSFILTGALTIYHFKEENENYHQERLRRKESAVQASLQYAIGDRPVDSQQTFGEYLQEKIMEIADINSLDIVVYSPAGEIIASSNAQLIKDGIVEPSISYDLIQALLRDKRSIMYETPSDTSNYLFIYDVIYGPDKEPLGIINLPYYESKEILKQDLEEFLQSLGTVYLGIFVITALLAYFFSNYITSSLNVIRNHLKTVRLNKSNEEIQWSSDDEIGQLVKEYNQMVAQLETNAIQLAQSERESAWQEMAKQVAHEIKNPLTPMRLLVQYYQKTAKPENPEKLEEFSKALIDQIDNLSSIASAFSQFATLPKVHMNSVDLTLMLQGLASLHNQVTFQIPEYNLFVLGDKDSLLRVLNNVLKNAEQAIPEETTPDIKVSLKEGENTVLISVSDNGVGIPEDKLQTVFDPNFTTKTQGMGLGLAMSRNIIQSHKGKIWAESRVGEGTTFYIELSKAQ
ncbi:MAG: HAMP domain-containing sensor histidine kinase [Schleiferiaceae bacterium]